MEETLVAILFFSFLTLFGILHVFIGTKPAISHKFMFTTKTSARENGHLKHGEQKWGYLNTTVMSGKADQDVLDKLHPL